MNLIMEGLPRLLCTQPLLNFLFFSQLLLPLGIDSFGSAMLIEKLLTLTFASSLVVTLDKRSSNVQSKLETKDRKSTRLNSSHSEISRMPSSA